MYIAARTALCAAASQAAEGHTARALECSECGQCETACPQQIEVIKEMAKASRMFDQPAS
jgi:predicted aldo/keto reductase-like oxidoreductase